MRNRFAMGLVASMVCAACLVVSASIASNMGFKFVPDIPGSSVWNLSLPWNNNYTDANSLLIDIPGATRVQRFQSSVMTWFPGANPANNFDIIKGEAYIVTVDNNGSNSAVIVGSHDPDFLISLEPDQTFNMSAPYHQTYTKASELMNAMNAQMGSHGVFVLQKFQANSTLLSWFPGASSFQNFDLELGMGVIAKAGATGGEFAWSHY